MRCKACDAVFTEVDMARTNPHTGEPDDMCGRCLKAVALYTDPEDDDNIEFPGTQDNYDEWED